MHIFINTCQLTVPTKAFPVIIGTKGTKAQELTQLSGARFDLDREKQLVTIKGTYMCICV
jgi:polyribonucleotide nucleotidyltransferase